ncbi:MAG: SCO family protein [Gammaproteobacteria bacterium]
MRTLRTLLVSFIVIVAGLLVLSAATNRFHAFTSATAERVVVRDNRPLVPAVELQAQTGTRINLANLRGQWLLVDFVYTRCTSYCAVLGAEYGELQRLLARPLARHRVRLVSISFDPSQDTPAALTQYVARYGSNAGSWLAARPVTARGLRELEHTFGVIVIPDGHGGFNHTAGMDMVDPEGRLVRVIGLGYSPAEVSRTVLKALQ